MEKIFEISEADLSSLEDFPIKWRWTDERWNKLPLEHLQQINPLVQSKAAELFTTHGNLFRSEKSNAEIFEREELIHTESAEFSIVREWLKQRIGYTDEDVFVSWATNLAVRTTGAIFCDYWNDFCYPVCDDLSVAPTDLKWVLLYRHEEYFWFGKIRKERFL